MNYKNVILKVKITLTLLSVLLVFSGNTAFCEELSGKVIETMNSSSYTYVHLEKDGKRQWVAVPETLIRAGDEIEVEPGMSMGSYTSPTLGRSFDDIIFSSGVKAITKRVVGAGDEKADSSIKELDIAKAEGENAYRIEEIFAQKKDLDGKTVKVRGKVVKVSKYQGKNWIRVVDGTGSRKRGNHKLILMSDQDAQKDDVIVATGTVRADKSFGALTYEVVVEDASLTK